MAQGLGIAALGQVAIGVADIDRAIAFYRDVLGLKFLFKAPPGLGFFDCGGVRLMLDQPLGSGKSSILYFKTGDIDAAFRTLAERNVAVLHAA
jgi:methylmalonyl-CoA/ethylmalonyl-CoA epimerase